MDDEFFTGNHGLCPAHWGEAFLVTRTDLACHVACDCPFRITWVPRVQLTGNVAMTSNWSILAVLTICWRSCTEPELFCSCLTPYFLRSKANWWFGCCLFWSSFGVFWFVWMCSVWLVVAFVCGFTLALLYQDRGFLNMVPVIVFTTTATIVTMSAAWDQKNRFPSECFLDGWKDPSPFL